MRSVSYLYLKENFIFPKLSQNTGNEEVFCGFYISRIDSKISPFSYYGHKTSGSPGTRRDPFSVLIVILPLYLPLRYQAGCSDSSFITHEPHQLPHDTVCVGSAWLLLINWSVL